MSSRQASSLVAALLTASGCVEPTVLSADGPSAARVRTVIVEPANPTDDEVRISVTYDDHGRFESARQTVLPNDLLWTSSATYFGERVVDSTTEYAAEEITMHVSFERDDDDRIAVMRHALDGRVPWGANSIDLWDTDIQDRFVYADGKLKEQRRSLARRRWGSVGNAEYSYHDRQDVLVTREYTEGGRLLRVVKEWSVRSDGLGPAPNYADGENDASADVTYGDTGDPACVTETYTDSIGDYLVESCFTYADGRLSFVDVSVMDGDRDPVYSVARSSFDYNDEGRVSVVVNDPDTDRSSDETTIRYFYDEGEAVGVSFQPSTLSEYGNAFDLEGRPFFDDVYPLAIRF